MGQLLEDCSGTQRMKESEPEDLNLGGAQGGGFEGCRCPRLDLLRSLCLRSPCILVLLHSASLSRKFLRPFSTRATRLHVSACILCVPFAVLCVSLLIVETR